MKIICNFLVITLFMGIWLTEGVEVMALGLKSRAFENNGYIPRKYTGEGQDISPALSWDNVPEGTKAFALICDDPDAPVGNWVHWVIYDIPKEILFLDEAIADDKILDKGIKQGKNDFGRIGYGGPMPPSGRPHRYFFTLYALDTQLEFFPGMSKKELLEKIKGHILQKGELIGLYKR